MFALVRALVALLKSNRGKVADFLQDFFRKIARVMSRLDPTKRDRLRASLSKATGMRGTIDKQLSLVLKDAKSRDPNWDRIALVMLIIFDALESEVLDMAGDLIPDWMSDWFESWSFGDSNSKVPLEAPGGSYIVTYDADGDEELTPVEVQQIRHDFDKVIQVTGSGRAALEFLRAVRRLTTSHEVLELAGKTAGFR
jgi:hypothetical protein